jgi:hypothetical protein
VQNDRHSPVDKSLRTGPVSHRAERQLGLPRHSDLAHQHNIERRIECLGNLEPDRDAAARQCQNHRLLVLKMRQLASEAATRIGAIRELHIPVSSKFGG